jgi:hypothetical protein
MEYLDIYHFFEMKFSNSKEKTIRRKNVVHPLQRYKNGWR